MRTDPHKREEFLTVEEVAAEWRQHPATIYRKVAAGEIPAVRLGDGLSALRIPRRELEARLAEQMSAMGSDSLEARSGSPLGRGSFVDAGTSPPCPQTPAARV